MKLTFIISSALLETLGPDIHIKHFILIIDNTFICIAVYEISLTTCLTTNKIHSKKSQDIKNKVQCILTAGSGPLSVPGDLWLCTGL